MTYVSKNSSLFLDFQLYKGRINATSHAIQHPMYGAGHKFRTLHLPVSTTLSEVLDECHVRFKYLFFSNYAICIQEFYHFYNFITFTQELFNDMKWSRWFHISKTLDAVQMLGSYIPAPVPCYYVCYVQQWQNWQLEMATAVGSC